MQIRRVALSIFALLIPLAVFAQEMNEQFWAAARKGDVETVKALLAGGVDVNAKTRYGATALSYACDKGHIEVIKLLLEKGADVNSRDTFYGEAPLGWALSKGNSQVVKLLLDKGAEGVDRVLMNGVTRNNAEMVKVALDKGGLKPQTMTVALMRAEKGNRADIVEILKKAGAAPPPQVDPETLKDYAGVYKNEARGEITFTLSEGKLAGAWAGQQPFTVAAIDKDTFTVLESEGVTIVFNSEAGKVVSLTLKQGRGTMEFKRVEQK